MKKIISKLINDKKGSAIWVHVLFIAIIVLSIYLNTDKINDLLTLMFN